MDFPPVELNDRTFNVEIITTRNRHAYAKVKDGLVIISLPSRMRADSAYKVAAGLYERIKKGMLKRPAEYINHADKKGPTFHDNQTITLMGRNFNFHISDTPKTKKRCFVEGDDIYIKLPEAWDGKKKDEAISYIARRILSREMEGAVEERVNTLNREYFNSNLKHVKLTNATTRWGSCTTTRGLKDAKIHLNFKLLFMPAQCLDYVIVHELTHTKIHNHSKAFWQSVGNIIPDYKERIKLLKQSAYESKMSNMPNPQDTVTEAVSDVPVPPLESVTTTL